ncbi:tetraspanin-5 isoform X1 [Chaetodon trifascialis]|uniref:tetraspanin-5 isoform X1 n=1 Tax=Chaetodon trifascialis TaxID=109706 RepID=UPI0039917000
MMSGKHFKAHEVSCCIKYFIFGFNIIFWFLGVAFLAIGLWAWSEKGVLSNISSITDLGGFDPVWLFLVVGGVMFILGFAGCIGALRENSFLLKFFSVFLGIIFFLELTAGVLAFVFKDWIKDQLNFFINNNIRAYRDDIDLQNLIDFTQEYWECCGAFGADDWNLNIYFNCTDSNPSREKCGVPFSCCTKDPAVGKTHFTVRQGEAPAGGRDCVKVKVQSVAREPVSRAGGRRSALPQIARLSASSRRLAELSAVMAAVQQDVRASVFSLWSDSASTAESGSSWEELL